ncbi:MULTISPECIES: ornithine cyclodeaminase family protein [unclassified Streptomyces]|uniref:ornithine cyclodeaminase family protein n=1 Tax=unclassified Streptomyces TaxID=2593676 RepID=UPI001F034AEA|nr:MULTISPECIES: ornithine cyclodeaminase family protein [unclassified Streptomyces]MCH0565973.1 ornithine cyclodeaminase family protein [Streptomyces sp. MUM 2J]MCH0569138.1 ornithine cyclodeaminase family protein [Streptomyces sp. MUM 136J]
MTVPTDRRCVADQLKIGSELLYLTRQDVEGLALTREDILELTRQALVEHGHRRYEMPAKIGVHPYDNVFYHAMPAYLPGPGIVGMKWIECYPDNPRTFGLPQTTGLLVLNDVDTGVPMAVMDSAWLTAMRTPAVTVLAAAALHPDATTFGMFGCGVQGVEHVRYAALALPRLKNVYVYDTDKAAADALIAMLQPELDLRIVMGESPEAVTKSAEVLSSATVILREPLAVVKDEWVTAGQTILPCDLNTFWDPRTALRADKYIVDSIEEHQLFASMGYFPDGLPEVAAETGEVLAGVKPGRERAEEIIVNSNIGMAVCDIAVGHAIMHRALGRGAGVRLPL